MAPSGELWAPTGVVHGGAVRLVTMRSALSVSAVCRVLLILVAFALNGCGKAAPPPAPPPEVLVIEVRAEDVPLYDDFVGTLDGAVNASLQARVQGYLTSQNYKEGGPVKTGDLLFQIDPRPFQAALAQANAALAQSQAFARQAETVSKRTAALSAEGLASAQERENSVEQAAAAQSQVAAQRAAVAQAQLNLDSTEIRSPIDGIAGLATAQVGDLVGPTTGVLATVSRVDSIKALFTVSDQRYVAYTRRWANDPEGRAEHERQLEFELILADGSRFAHKGRLFAVDTEVDVRTGSQQIVALFPNPDNVLRPGQFVRVRMRSELLPAAVLVPERAVNEIQGTHQVVVVGAGNKAEIRMVKAGRRIDRKWIIESGLKPGERIVVEGLQKARGGLVVNPKPWTPPATSPTPTNP
jgi:RND family efflux transporter MFP subunit